MTTSSQPSSNPTLTRAMTLDRVIVREGRHKRYQALAVAVKCENGRDRFTVSRCVKHETNLA
jgi:hypothetical protein